MALRQPLADIQPNSAGHTPGPWEHYTGPSLSGRFHTVEAGDREVMICECYEGPDDQKEANARLIAAAPELLEALQKIERRLFAFGHVQTKLDRHDVASMLDETRSAIAKATGAA